MSRVKTLLKVLVLSLIIVPTGLLVVYAKTTPSPIIIVKDFKPNKLQILKQKVVIITTKEGLGSGVLVSPTGVIVTNHHVVENNKTVVVHFQEKLYAARVVLIDPRADIAVIQIVGDRSDLPFVNMEKDSQQGDSVIAIGTPLGIEKFISKGIVSKEIYNRDGTMEILHDATIAPGSSGGGLFNENGELIGINTYQVTLNGVPTGIGGAIATRTFYDEVQNVINLSLTRI